MDGKLFAIYLCMNNLKSFGMFLALVTIGFVNSASAAPELSNEVQWGGEGISLQVHRKPRAHANITFDCASGNVNHIHLDNKGGFLASGTYTQLSGARPQHPPVAVPAHYVGYAKDGTMSLMVVIDSDPGHPATYLLKKGARGDVHYCE